MPPLPPLLRLVLVGAALAWAALACAGPQRPALPPGPELDPAIVADQGRDRSGWLHLAAPAMATHWEITLPDTASAEAAAQQAFAAIARVESQANEWRADSPLAALTRGAGGDFQEIPRDLYDLLRLSCQLAEASGGAFDPTWAALWGLWDFRPGAPPHLPDPQQVQQRVAKIGWRHLQLQEGPPARARLDQPGMALGLGAIAKGWALDRAAAALRAAGVRDFLLQAGGQMLAGGSRDGQPWRVGLRHPRLGGEEVWAAIDLRDGESLSTSGDYEHFWLWQGERFHHILDPRTGYPAGRGHPDWPYAMAVLAQGGARADALSTAALVLGPGAEAQLGRLVLGLFEYGPQGPKRSGPRAGALQLSP